MYTQQTKIVATIGPASDKKEIFEKLVDAGLDVARINFSHGTHKSNGAAIKMIASVAKEKQANVAVLADLQGPRVRTVIEGSQQLIDGMIVRVVGIGADDDAHALLSSAEVPVIGFDQPVVVEALREGHRIFIEDGLKQLVVTDVTENRILAEVRVGGEVKNHKGINLPDTDVPLPALTEKDVQDLAFMLSAEVVGDVNFIALSFVRRASDVENLRRRIADNIEDVTKRPRIIVKIERPEAVENLDEIIAATDAVMVARGDLATETGQEGVVLLQKRIIALAARQLKPVIVATQMLGSMEHAPRPTRAEISDVTNAVIDHADATMLSGETAGGDFPVESVATMSRIIHETEISPFDDVDALRVSDIHSVLIETARRTWTHARSVSAEAIACATADGDSARALAHFRPSCQIIALCTSRSVQRQLALVWGVVAYYDKDALEYSADELLVRAGALARVKNVVIAQ